MGRWDGAARAHAGLSTARAESTEHAEAPLTGNCRGKFKVAPGGRDPELQVKELGLNSVPVKSGDKGNQGQPPSRRPAPGLPSSGLTCFTLY